MGIKELYVNGMIACMSTIVCLIPLYGSVKEVLDPSIEHLEKAKAISPGEMLIVANFGSGSYSCNGDVCDYSNSYKERQYIDFPKLSQLITINYSHDGIWTQKIEAITVTDKLNFVCLYLLGIAGLIYVIKKAREN